MRAKTGARKATGAQYEVRLRADMSLKRKIPPRGPMNGRQAALWPYGRGDSTSEAGGGARQDGRRIANRIGQGHIPWMEYEP